MAHNITDPLKNLVTVDAGKFRTTISGNTINGNIQPSAIMMGSDPIQNSISTLQQMSLGNFFTHLDKRTIKAYICSEHVDLMMMELIYFYQKPWIDAIAEKIPSDELGKPFKRMMMEKKLARKQEDKT
jgi:hypothetical protein